MRFALLRVSTTIFNRHIDDLTPTQVRQAIEIHAHTELWNELTAEAYRDEVGR